jgi:hypothetical protein
MKPEDLAKVWDAPDHSRLTPKQLSIRLPILVAAKISALCEMFPKKTKTQIIGDLLATALDQFEEGLPSERGDFLGAEPKDLIDFEIVSMYEDVGLKGRFIRLTKKYLREIEMEANIKEQIQIDDPIICLTKD